MTFPKDISKIDTNLSHTNFIKIIKAIKNNKVEWGNNTIYIASRCAHFVYKGQKFEVIERYEEVKSLYKIEGD